MSLNKSDLWSHLEVTFYLDKIVNLSFSRKGGNNMNSQDAKHKFLVTYDVSDSKISFHLLNWFKEQENYIKLSETTYIIICSKKQIQNILFYKDNQKLEFKNISNDNHDNFTIIDLNEYIQLPILKEFNINNNYINTIDTFLKKINRFYKYLKKLFKN